MQHRQTSLFSFLQKLTPGNEGSCEPYSSPDAIRHARQPKKAPHPTPLESKNNSEETSDEIGGTDASSQKMRRQVLSAGIPVAANDGDRRANHFSSIMSKFVKEDKSGCASNGKSNQDCCGSFICHPNDSTEKSVKDRTPDDKCSAKHVSAIKKSSDGLGPLYSECDLDVLGPETPAVRPRVPLFKRIQQDPSDSDKQDSSLFGPNKRFKPIGKTVTEKKILENSCESTSSKFEWLVPFKIRDANGRRPSDPFYDKRTLYIPPDALKRMSASQRQYWSVKCQYMDVVIFFKVGKFYELYELDAEIGQRELDWKMTISGVGKCRQVGVSEAGIDDAVHKLTSRGTGRKMRETVKGEGKRELRAATVVVAEAVVAVTDGCVRMRTREWRERRRMRWCCCKRRERKKKKEEERCCCRYNVGRMEQLETSEQAKARGASSVIQRKLVNVSTPCTPSDGNMEAEAVHLLALKEGDCGSKDGSIFYGFAFLDNASLKCWVGSISNDNSCAALGALLVQISPKEIIHERSGLSEATRVALKKYASAGSMKIQLTATTPGVDFLDSSEVMKLASSKGYFKGSSKQWFSAIDGSVNCDLAICALGGLITHLSRLMLDDTLRNGELFSYHVYKNCLRMDGQTLLNLEIFSNNVDGGLSGTLYKHLDHCLTASGKRLLRRWICHPLRDFTGINQRLDVVEAFIKNSEIMSLIASYLTRIPDLERLLGRVRSTVGSSSMLLLPFVGDKILKQRIKTFGFLVKGLRIGLELLNMIRKEDHGMLPISLFVNIPNLSSLDDLLNQFEVALEDDFPHYQDHIVKDSDAETLAVLVELFSGKAIEWSQVINALNCIDVLQSFARASISSFMPMSRPILLVNAYSPNLAKDKDGPMLHMKGLWHPYAVSGNGNDLVPNEIHLGNDSKICHPCALLLTGPNMGGKSTLLRATCLAVILAQLGCFVPCEECMLSPVDTIFTRLGATDRIMSGTFYVECSETASVLRNATKDSLVLLDELGRGTSTFDGYAIAYAVFRHLLEKVCCRLLFATHYHPLTKEFGSHPHVSLQHMACSFHVGDGISSPRNDLVFLYKLAPGACSESYGLQVALMAGLPKQVVEAAASAGQNIKQLISRNFKSSEARSEFSTLHEEWLKSLWDISKPSVSLGDEDISDTLLCLWHELRSFYKLR
ncbi:hypothetical protein ZIOFF_026473 [Zingiber officinale]|uniref:DNA mismatch repair protein n=1 Tax=Zingiber officinale TaxID=94328 RepID=A0A8J5H4C0_ZINOF|nr:hypothetical protein ZIOFF_026473 [Zingiber officinale]